MTTRLNGPSTRFLPFNRGRDGGAGNPPVEGKHRTCYLWEEVWQRDNLLELVGRFLHLQTEEEKDPDTGRVTVKESMIFPRYHQWDCVQRLLAAARQKGRAPTICRSTRRARASPTPSPGSPTGWPRCTTTRTARSTTPWWC